MEVVQIIGVGLIAIVIIMVLKQNKLIENSSAWEGTLGHFLGQW